MERFTYKHVTRFHGVCNAERSLDVLREYGRAETVRRVVRLLDHLYKCIIVSDLAHIL